MIVVFAQTLLAQGSTTGAIGGRVTDSTGRGLSLAEVVVTNRATGASVRTRSRGDGRYDVGGLEVGGPYSLAVRHIGWLMREQHGLFVTLGKRLEVDVQLDQGAVTLQVVETRATLNRARPHPHMGTEALISAVTIERSPILNRDLYDLVRLVPQMSTRFSLAAPGVGAQLNSIRIDGVSEQGLSGNLPAGSVYGGKSLPLDAVEEYQVLLAPYDVRYGNFAGATIDAVTRGGTNQPTATAFLYGTNERLGPAVPFIRDARYEKQQFGFSVGGPIVRDRLLFFLAAEIQRRSIPALGPYVGQDASNGTALPVDVGDVARFQRVLSGYGLDGGSAGAVDNSNPSANLSLRIDAPVPAWNSRLVVRGNFSRADSQVFARPTPAPNSNCPSAACFPLSSVRAVRSVRKGSIASQLYTNFSRGVYNELIVGAMNFPVTIGSTGMQPLVLVTVPGATGQSALLQSGTPELSTDSTGSTTAEVTDNLTIPLGAHRVVVGLTTQRFALHRFDLRGVYGIWEFGSLDALEAGTPSHYRLARDFGRATTDVRGSQSAMYIGDEWDVTPSLSLTLGLRADVPGLSSRPPNVAVVDSLLGRRTDQLPARAIQWSPRIGFRHGDLTGVAGSAVVRGGVGVFTGRPPVAWLLGPFTTPGLPTSSLQCGALASDAGPAPAFVASVRDAPLTCANGSGSVSRPAAEIDVFDREMRYPQVWRGSLALERQLTSTLVASVEALYTRTIHAMFFSPVNLGPPVAIDRHGRTMYGTVGPTGIAAPNRLAPSLGDAVLAGSTSGGDALDLTAELRTAVTDLGDVQLSLTYARDRDVQSQRIVRPVLLDNWRLTRPVAGSQDDRSPGISDFDIPFRVRASGAVHTPSLRWRTQLSLYYVGGSGLPFTYVAGGAQGRGDLNADGGAGNDPIYIPRSAGDTAEIQFAGPAAEVLAQQRAFDDFVDGDACLRRQRGRIMERNSCRAPWTNLVNLGLRQTVPGVNGHAIALEFQVFNLLNFLDRRWGQAALPTLSTFATTSQLPLLSQVGETTGPPSAAQPVYRFDPAMQRYSTQNLDSYYQIQLAVRYTVGR